MGSQRLTQKNLRELGGVSLIARAIRKCTEAKVFDEIWVNSEHDTFAQIAQTEGARFHRRPEHLGAHSATSEDFVKEFLTHHDCDFVFQVHSIAPFLSVVDIRDFVGAMTTTEIDCLLSYEPIQIECAMAGEPVNFSFSQKTNSQNLTVVQRITWSITGWRRSSYLDASERGACATYAGRVAFFPVNRYAALIIKTQEDLELAQAMLIHFEQSAATNQRNHGLTV
jgi:CMP-N-acetylneuraminic acid synthetase